MDIYIAISPATKLALALGEIDPHIGMYGLIRDDDGHIMVDETGNAAFEIPTTWLVVQGS